MTPVTIYSICRSERHGEDLTLYWLMVMAIVFDDACDIEDIAAQTAQKLTGGNPRTTLKAAVKADCWFCLVYV